MVQLISYYRSWHVLGYDCQVHRSSPDRRHTRSSQLEDEPEEDDDDEEEDEDDLFQEEVDTADEDRVSKASFVSGKEVYLSRSEIVDKLYDKYVIQFQDSNPFAI